MHRHCCLGHARHGSDLVDDGLRQRGQRATVLGVELRVARDGDVVDEGGTVDEVDDLTFRPDGRLLASVGKDGTQRLWDAATGRLVGEPVGGRTREVTAVAADPRGFGTAIAGDDGTISILEFERDVTLDQACRIAHRDPTDAEWEHYVGAEPYRSCLGS